MEHEGDRHSSTRKHLPMIRPRLGGFVDSRNEGEELSRKQGSLLQATGSLSDTARRAPSLSAHSGLPQDCSEFHAFGSL